VFAVAAPSELVSALLTISFFITLAFILPRAWLGLALVVLIPLQFYFPFTVSFYLRGAFVFVIAATARVLLSQRLAISNQQSAVSSQRSAVGSQQLASVGHRSSVIGLLSSFVLRPSSWTLPAALFLVTAFIAALGATNRYAAFKGIYDWLPIFATAFVVGETTRGMWRARIVKALVMVGVAEALLGWIQTWFTPSQIAEILQMGVSAWSYQPNLLRERLAEFSFNWILGNRVLPFGTFINGIDYALFLAAIFALGLGLLVSGFKLQVSSLRITHHVLRFTFYVLALALIALVLLQTLKGSGLLAFAGAIAMWVWLYGARLRPSQMLFIVIIGVVALLLLGAMFFEPLTQRATFLLQRETAESYETGRLEVWRQLVAALPQRPLFGFGLNNAGQFIAPTQSLRGGTFTIAFSSPESAYVATLVETGVIGFVFLLWFLGAVLVRAYRRARHSTLDVGILAAIVALLCGNLTVAALTTDQNAVLLGVLIGLVFANDERAHE
jgi:O-antigen ligase